MKGDSTTVTAELCYMANGREEKWLASASSSLRKYGGS